VTDEETNHYTRPELNAEVSMGPDGNFTEVLSGPSCLDPEKAREALRILRELPPDRRAVWVKRLDLAATLKRCPLVRDDPELSKGFADLVEAYRGPGTT